MKPPYHLTQKILQLITSVSEKLGEVNANYLSRQSPQLRKSNRIKTIHSSLSIEGNTLSEEQITALLENKRVLGPQKDITEVLNAIKVYDQLRSFKSTSEKSFLKAHRLLMNGLIKEPGKYRTRGVGIVKGKKVEHVAPPAQNLPFLMKNLFAYLKDKNELPLIKSCVFHYELEFIHPFIDGNGRMGRLWQSLILSQAALGLSDRKSFQERYLKPALAEGLIEMTIPSKPNSRSQKYRLTSKGREWISIFKG